MSNWRKRVAALAATVLAMAGLVIAGGAVVSPAQAADCNNTVYWHQGYNDLHNNGIRADYTDLKNGPSVECGNVGQVHRWTDIRMHCAGWNSAGYVWVHIRDTNYGRNGWVRKPWLTDAVQASRVQLC